MRHGPLPRDGHHLKELKAQGFNGVQNFPTVGLIDGVFRQNLEETGMGYGLEVDMIRKAHELDNGDLPLRLRRRAGACNGRSGRGLPCRAHGSDDKGLVGARPPRRGRLHPLIREIIAARPRGEPRHHGHRHGGPIADPEDAAYIIRNVPEIDGFFGASSIERLASERGMTAQAAAFKAISK